MAERKTYTEEQKAEILKRAEETSVSAAAKEFGVSVMSITRWKAANKAAAEKIETKKTVRAAGRKVKEKTAEAKKEIKAGAAEVKDNVTAAKIETKKKTRGAARKAKAAVENTAEKVAGDIKDAADKAESVAKIETGKVKAKRARKAAEKVETKEQKAEDKKEAKEKRAAKKPSTKIAASKVNMVFQSTMGGAITPEQIALKLPKGVSDVYVKLEENKAYYVLKDGTTGNVEIW